MENKKFYVYVWFIVSTGEIFYIGKGSGRRYKSLSSRSRRFMKVLEEHECSSRIVQFFDNEDDALSKEAELIGYYSNVSSNLVNATFGGDGSRANGEFTDWQRGMIKKSRNAPSSVYKTPEFRNKISTLVQGNLNPNFGNKWTKEMKESLSKKQKESNRYNGAENPNSKKIMCLETGESFKCIKDAMEKYGVKNAASFTAAINKPTRTAAKLHWITI